MVMSSDAYSYAARKCAEAFGDATQALRLDDPKFCEPAWHHSLFRESARQPRKQRRHQTSEMAFEHLERLVIGRGIEHHGLAHVGFGAGAIVLREPQLRELLARIKLRGESDR